MARTTHKTPWSVETNTEWIDATSGYESPDESWRFTDANGHDHHYESGYPTLDFVVDEQHWCDGSEGLFNHDGHMAIDKAHYECKECGVVVEPRMDPPFTPKKIRGMITVTVEGMRSDGATVAFRATEAEAAQMSGLFGDEEALDALMRELIEGLPMERFHSFNWSSR